MINFSLVRGSLASSTGLLSCVKSQFGAFKHQNLKCAFDQITSQISSTSRFFGTFKSFAPVIYEASRQTHSPIFHNTGSSSDNCCGFGQHFLTAPPSPFYTQTRGLKIKGKVKRRCRDCYLMWVNGLLYNLCKTHGRHKQVLKGPYFANTRCMTHATQSPKRPW